MTFERGASRNQSLQLLNGELIDALKKFEERMGTGEEKIRDLRSQ